MRPGTYAPGRQQEGAPKDGRGNFLRHKYTKNSVSSLEAKMGTEGQIKCIEQCTFQRSSVVFLGPQNAAKSSAVGASPQTPLGELTALPKPPCWV